MRSLARICMFLLLSVSSFSGMPNELIFVKKSSVQKNVVTVDGEIKGKEIQLICFVSEKNCQELSGGTYLFIRLKASEGTYNDCPNIDVYTNNSADKQAKQLGEYCLLGSDQ